MMLKITNCSSNSCYFDQRLHLSKCNLKWTYCTWKF